MNERIAEPSWHAVFNDLQEAVWVVDAASRTILFANTTAGSLVGLPAGDMVGEPVGRFAATPQDHWFWADTRSAVADGVGSLTALLTVDGQLVPVMRRVTNCTLPSAVSTFLVTMVDCSERQNTQRELELLLSELRATLDSAVDGILVRTLDGRIRAFNQRLATIWGIPHALLVSRDDAALHRHFGSRVRGVEAYEARLSEIIERSHTPSHDVLHLHGGQIVERRSVAQLSHGSVIGRVFSFRDITKETLAQNAQRMAALAFDSSPYAIFFCDERHCLVQVNPALERLSGLPASLLLGRLATSVFGISPDGTFLSQVQSAWQLKGIWNGELWLSREEDEGNAVQLEWVALKRASGEIEQSIGFVRDLTQQHAARKRIDELAYNDVLTGLPNRLQLAQRVDSALRALLPGTQGFAVLLLDLDRFKVINDSLGHNFGDRVLRLVAARLQLSLRQSDMLCRQGGDEYVVYLHASDGVAAENVARRIVQEMLQPFSLDEMSFSIQCSIGISLYPQDGNTLDELIRHADTAMYRVKDRGRGNYGFYQPQMNENMLARMQLEHAMRQALTHDAMQVHFQPQVDLSTGRIVGAEALLRWTDETLGVVSPAEFIPLAEETGYIITLGSWVLDRSVQEAARWARAGMELVVSVNVSALELRQTGFVQRVAQVLELHQLPPRLLELELTESMLLQDAAEAEKLLHELSSLGIALAIDDFGTGYSSLGYLKKLPIHKLKIDQSFVRGLPGDEGDRAIVSAIVHLGEALKLCVVAEGVETEAQRQELQNLNCVQFQGYLCSPALPPQQFVQFVQTTTAALAQRIKTDHTAKRKSIKLR